MKKTLIVVLCVVLLTVASCFALAACKSDTVTITLMDGDTKLGTKEVELGTTFTLDNPVKTNYTFVNWYLDKELTKVYTPDKAMYGFTLYAKFIASEYTIVINPNGGELASEDKIVTVKPGEDYTLKTPTREGYTFVNYLYDTAEADNVVLPLSGKFDFTSSIRVRAQWTETKYTVSFMDGTTQLASTSVTAGTTVIAPTPSKAGYKFAGWLDADNQLNTQTSFTVTANATYTAKYEAKHFSITVENLASADVADVAYGAEFSLPAEPTLPEWATAFEGYFIKGAPIENLTETEGNLVGTYNWTENIIIVAKFTRDSMYQKSIVTVYTTDNTPPTVLTVDNGSIIADQLENLVTPKAGYNWNGWTANGTAFNVTTAITDNITLHADYSPKTLQITIQKDYAADLRLTATYGETLELPNPAARNGYKFLGYKRGTADFSAASLDVADFDLSGLVITEAWESLNPDNGDDDKTFVAVKNDQNEHQNYFKERESTEKKFTYVFLTNYTYHLAGIDKIGNNLNDGNSTGENDYMSWKPENDGDGIELTLKQLAGNTNIYVTRSVSATEDYTYPRSVKVVNNVQLGNGGDYSSVWVQKSSNDSFEVAITDDTVMEAGVSNFIPDITLNTIVGNGVQPLDYALSNMQVEVTVDEVPTNDYSVDANGVITFGNSLKDKTAVLTLTPKYTTTNAKATFKLSLNDGVNVYTNDELKANYATLNVHKINVLRNITAQLWDEDYDRSILSHGHQVESVTLWNNYNDAEAKTSTTYQIDTGTIINDYSHSAYARLASRGDNIVINGNYFKIDGSKLPYVDNRYTYRNLEGDASGYRMGNVQVGIFLYRTYFEAEGKRYQNGHVTLNNLLIEGNTIGLNDTVQELDDGGLPVLKNSTAFNGLWVRGGTANLNNVTFTKNNIGIGTDAGVDADDNTKQSVVINMDHCRFANNWADNIYAYRLTQFNITNSNIGNTTGGPSIVFDDKPEPSAVPGLASELNMDAYTWTNLQNWVIGTEAWWIGQGQSANAAKVKADLEAGVNQAGMSILRSETVGTTKTDYMNFVIFVQKRGDPDGAEGWTSDNDGDNEIHINFTTGFNIVQDAGGGASVCVAANGAYYVLWNDHNAMGGMILVLPLYPKTA